MTKKSENETENNEKELDQFQIRNISLLTHLLMHDAVTDDIVENIRKSELDYFSLINKYKLLEEKVNVDEKTNLLKFKNDYLTDIIKTAQRIYYGSDAPEYHISLIRFDIDDFSKFNNEYGHDIGDTVLISIANLIRETSRPTDYVIRFGGEEFDVILPSTDLEGANIFLKKIFKKININKIECNGKKLKVTVSAGVAHFVYSFGNEKIINDNKIQKQFKTLQRQADNALYEAKYLGKNCYCVFSKNKKDEYAKIRKKYIK